MTALVMFKLADREFALDVMCVREVIRMVALTSLPSMSDMPSEVMGAIIVRGMPVLVVDLRKRFGLPLQPPNANSPLLLIDTGKLLFAALVDQVTGVIHVKSDPGGLLKVDDRLVSRLDPQQLPTQSMLSLLSKLEPASS